MTQLYKWPCPYCKNIAAAYIGERESMDVRCPRCGALMRWRRDSREWFSIKIKL